MHFASVPSVFAALILLAIPAHAQCKNITYLFGNYTLPAGEVALLADRNSTTIDFKAYNTSALRATAEGLELFMMAPSGGGKRQKVDGGFINQNIATKSELNSTFLVGYGSVTAEMKIDAVPGVVANLVVIASDKEGIRVSGDSIPFDEVDIEILGSTPENFTTNTFKQFARDKAWESYASNELPLPKTNGSTKTPSIEDWHTYRFDWNKDRIVWSVDGVVSRQLNRNQTKDGKYYPTRPGALGISIWDASWPVGTANWAKGPIAWEKVKDGRVTATIRRLDIRCP